MCDCEGGGVFVGGLSGGLFGKFARYILFADVLVAWGSCNGYCVAIVLEKELLN